MVASGSEREPAFLTANDWPFRSSPTDQRRPCLSLRANSLAGMAAWHRIARSHVRTGWQTARSSAFDGGMLAKRCTVTVTFRRRRPFTPFA